MFACYSGIKSTEIRTLQWKDLTMKQNRWTMHIEARNLDVSLTNDAMQWLPQRGKAKVADYVFNDLPCDNAIHYIIIDWMKAANLPEEITFGTSFHSYEHHNAKSRAQIKEETKDSPRHTRWRLNKISKRAQENVVEAKQVQKEDDKPQHTSSTTAPKAETPKKPLSKQQTSPKASAKPKQEPQTIDLPIDALDALFGK